MTADTNEVQVNGLSLTLRETGDVKIEVKSDPDSVVSFINEFVSAYNTLIADLNTLYSATKIDTTPLTDDEKAEMTEKQIDEYEQNIKNSLLRRDSSLKTVIDTLRTSMQQVVSDNTFGSLAAVGITTGDYSENGKLYVDETTLKAALEKDPEAVKNLFTGTGTKDADGKVVSNTVGLATRLNTNMQALFKSVTGIKSYKSYYNDKVTKDKITSMTNKISDLQDKYDAMEEIYYAKFTAMEKAMATLNSQSSSFLSMLG
jgi:flagellar hook-associated protein 2